MRIHRHLLTSLSAVLGLSAAALVGPLQTAGASETASSGWGPVAQVSRAPADVFDLELASTGDGTAALAAWVRWRGRDTRLMTALRRADGAWGRPTVVPGSRNATEVEVAFDGQGRAVVAWTSGRTVKATRRSPTGEFRRPSVLHRTQAGPRGTRPGYLALAVNRRGRAVVAWETVDDDMDGVRARSRVQAVIGTAAGSWTRARRVSTQGRESVRPEVAIDRTGRATVVWAEARRARWRVTTASREVGAPWQLPRGLSRPQERAGLPQLAALATGQLAVAYGFRGPKTSGIRVRRWAPGTGWAGPQTSPCAERGCAEGWTDAAMSADLRVSVAWVGRRGAVRVDDLTATGQASRARVAGPRSVFYGIEIAVNEAGDAVVGWTSVEGGHHPVQGAYRPRGGRWEQAQNLSADRGDSWGPALVVEDDGAATAVWSHGTNAEFSSIVRARTHPAK